MGELWVMPNGPSIKPPALTSLVDAVIDATCALSKHAHAETYVEQVEAMGELKRAIHTCRITLGEATGIGPKDPKWWRIDMEPEE